MKSKILLTALCTLGIAGSASAKERIYVNDEVTTHIVMPENIKMVDISTTKLIGNQCANNIVRIKPYVDSDSIRTYYRENEINLTLYNNVTFFNDGRELFKDIFYLIENAKTRIHIESYIFRDDELGKRLVCLLKKKCKEGIKVKVVYDPNGNLFNDKEDCFAGKYIAFYSHSRPRIYL